MLGKVYLVGAGPGDVELLTLKAARLLGEADILFHDHLVGSDILKLVNPNCKMVFVGKKNRCHVVKQEETNQLLVEAAKQYKTVVRLKGGDSFVFGRGGEEGLALNENNIEFEIIPGISSSIGAPAYAGIPVTHRKVARSVTIITGHQAKGVKEQLKWGDYAKLETLVILMGVYKRVEIAMGLIAGGRSVHEPVAFIEQATTKNQKVVIATLGEVAAGTVEVQSPAVTVIGEVVKLRNNLKWFKENCAPIENEFTPINEKEFEHSYLSGVK